MRFLALFFVLFSFEVFASDCQQDAKKFCDNVDPGKGLLAKCLDDFKDKLSAACSKELKEFKTKTALRNPCYEDLAQFCTDFTGDPERLEYCLLKNESKLGKTCSADFTKKKPKLFAKNVCAQDIANHCYTDIGGPDGSIMKCLINNRQKLSPNCGKDTDTRIAKMRKGNPCFDETLKHCPKDVKFADIQACMEKKLPSLTPACKTVVEGVLKKANANPCYRDLIRHCKPGISPDEQNRCLTINEKEVSNACKQFRANSEDKIKKMVENCEPDRMRFCPKAPFNDGLVIKCLKENKAKLSDGCKKLI